MTRVCLVGADDVNLRYELLSRETARDALATYDLREPFENAVGLETVSLGAAVALLNDLNWYLVRFVDEAMVLEPSVSESEWLSRELATAVRDDAVGPDELARFLKIYGLEPASADDPDGSDPDGAERGDAPAGDDGADSTGPKRLVEPMYVTRTGGAVPDYDLREVEETVVERVTESEFGA
ncbi:hypothetical protein C475_12220 [Halosimplex carlsbadense 2-9-1]|uniref:Uncharacterized protein n=1 Tax=Halosimplex carlsbadense 2-9-1 TaxID=797114 RepID=M0CQW4_9EURY|nr:DUF5804 family protein [Halosimplex carlsbadense]ELZ25003.1 hypothetical protein C475_12220 [Halosimplex carlsbadense 2-9-1]